MVDTLADENSRLIRHSEEEVSRKPRRRRLGPDAADSYHQSDNDRMTFLSRMMLSAQLMGAEASITFEQLYAVPNGVLASVQTMLPNPTRQEHSIRKKRINITINGHIPLEAYTNLQTLGMPVSMMSMTGIFSGPAACFLVPFIGWCADRGANPMKNKNCMLVVSVLFNIIGVIVITIANLLNAQYNASAAVTNPQTQQFNYTMNSDNASDCVTASIAVLRTYTGKDTDGNYSADFTGAVTALSTNPVIDFQPQGTIDVATGVPITAAIGMLGYALMETGYDCSTSTIRTWMITCSPPPDPTPTLVAGLVVTSAGGILSSVLGIVDLPSIFGFTSKSQMGFVIQITIQSVVVVVVTLLTLVSSMVVGNRQYRKLGNSQVRNKPTEDFHQQNRTEDITESIFTEVLFPSEPDGFQSSISVTSNPDCAFVVPQTISCIAGCDEDTGAVADGQQGHGGQGLHDDTTWDSPDQAFIHYSSQENFISHVEPKRSLLSCRPCHGFKATLALLCSSTFFSVSVVILFLLTNSDYVGKAIFGGDPDAPPGSDSLARYESGVRTASYGFLIYFVTYLAFSCVQQRVLDFMGYKMEYVVTQIIISLLMLLLSITARIEVFFLVSAMAGIHRAVFHVVPFAVMSSLVQAEARAAGGGQTPRLGLAMALVTTTMPVAYSSIFPWVGPLIAATGMVAIPLWFSAVYACIAAGLFSLITVK